jgi:hypothetical protein
VLTAATRGPSPQSVNGYMALLRRRDEAVGGRGMWFADASLFFYMARVSRRRFQDGEVGTVWTYGYKGVKTFTYSRSEARRRPRKRGMKQWVVRAGPHRLSFPLIMTTLSLCVGRARSGLIPSRNPCLPLHGQGGLHTWIIPVNIANSHWVLAVVLRSAKELHLWDPSGGGDTVGVLGHVAAFVRDVLADKDHGEHGPGDDATSWKRVTVHAGAPLQGNWYVYV